MSWSNHRWGRGLQLALGVLLVALFVWPCTAPAAQAAERVGEVEVFTITPDGSYVIFSAPLPGAPDTYGLFSRPLPHGAVVRIDGTSGMAEAPRFAISPDSQRVVFGQTLSEGLGLVGVTVDGTTRVELGTIPAQYGTMGPIWFGSEPLHAIVTTFVKGSSADYLFSLPLQGGGPTLLDQGEVIGISPQSHQVVYLKPTPQNTTLSEEMYSASIAGGAPVKLGLPPQLNNLPSLWTSLYSYDFSSDGSRLIFYSATEPYSASLSGIYSVPLDGSPAVQLNQGIEARRPLLDLPRVIQYRPFLLVPGTDEVIFTAKPSGLYRVPVAGGTPVAVPGTVEHQAGEFYRVSPDGHWLTYAGQPKDTPSPDLSGLGLDRRWGSDAGWTADHPPTEVFLVALDSGATRALGMSMAVSEFSYTLVFTPDSRQVLAFKEDKDTQLWNLHSTPVMGGAPVNLSSGAKVKLISNAYVSGDSRYALLSGIYLVPLQQAGGPFKIIEPGVLGISNSRIDPQSRCVVFISHGYSEPQSLYVASMELSYVFLPQVRRP